MTLTTKKLNTVILIFVRIVYQFDGNTVFAEFWRFETK